MQKTIETRARVLTVRKEEGSKTITVSADICVVGAGIAGVSAALEAARLGHKVVLADVLPTLGGEAVNSVIGIFCGLLSNGSNFYQFTYGIAEEILRDLGAQGGLHYRRGDHNVVMYDEVLLSRWIEEAVREAGITTLLTAALRGANVDGKRIVSIDLGTRWGDVCVKARSFVDATGDAMLAWQAGLPCRVPACGTVYGSHMLVLEGIPGESWPGDEAISARLKEKGKDYGLRRCQGFAFYFPPRKTVLVNMTHVETPLEPVSGSAKTLEGKKQADAVVAFLRGEFPGVFGSAKVKTYGVVGARQTRWIVGRYQLTEDDIRSGRRFEDAVARTSWPIELHDHEEGYTWEAFPEDHVHYVPFSSMISPHVDNLVAAGRCIDGDLVALSSVRVMGPCMAMGAAAAHALSLAGDGSVHDIDIRALQERVSDNLVRKDRPPLN